MLDHQISLLQEVCFRPIEQIQSMQFKLRNNALIKFVIARVIKNSVEIIINCNSIRILIHY